MGKINIMNDSLVGKIQAGEVVERPSSVVKELVENSIDAGSKNITIYLGLGGLEYIRIIDDGEGMDNEDVLKAFIPHATSKIKTEYDFADIVDNVDEFSIVIEYSGFGTAGDVTIPTEVYS